MGEVSEDLLREAIDRRDTTRISELSERADPSTVRGESGFTALHVAAAEGDTQLVTKLLLRGCSPDMRIGSLATPMMLASYHGHLACVREMLVHSSDQKNRSYSLVWAALTGHLHVVEELIQCGADPYQEVPFVGDAVTVAELHGHDVVAARLRLARDTKAHVDPGM